MKKLFAVLLVLSVFCIGVFSISFAANLNFADVINTKYSQAVEKLVKLNIVNGFDDGTFRPNADVTRAQVCKMLVEGLGLKNVNEIPLTKFSDVTTSIWSYPYIKAAVDNGIIVGYPDDTFKPNKNVTYAEMITMVLRAMNLEAKMTDKTWPTGYITEANKYGLLNNVTYEADVNAPAPRGETAVALFNMVNKIETDKQKEELARLEQEKKAQEEAKKNAVSFGIVTEYSYSKSTYYLKIDGIKTKQEVYSLNGSKKLTESKVEALEGKIIAYRDTDDGLEVVTSYDSSVLNNAKLVSSISGNVVTFVDKDKWDTSTTSLKTTYLTYKFARVKASFDKDDGTITFDSISDLGFGITSVSLAKNERVYVDSTDKIVLVFKGFSNTDTIKKGKVTSTEDEKISDYGYGFVNKVTTKSKVTTARIDKEDFEVYTKSNDFEEDTFAVYTTRADETISLHKSYGVADLDSNAEIVSSVSGKKGAQTLTYKGSSTEIDYYTKANVSKYKSYVIASFDIEPNSKDYLEVSDHDYYESLDDVSFTKGDRIIIDTKTKVFLIFSGLEVNDVVRKGEYTSAADEANKTYSVNYVWKNNKALTGVSLPATAKVKSGNSYTVTVPTKEGYTITASKTGSFKIYENTTITLSYTEKSKYTVTYKLASGMASGVVTLPASEQVYAGTKYTAKVPTATGYKVTASPATVTVNSNTTITISFVKQGLTPEEQEAKEKKIKEAEAKVTEAQSKYDKVKSDYDAVSKDVTAAETAANNALKAYNAAKDVTKNAQDEKANLEKEIATLTSAAEKTAKAFEEAVEDVKLARYDLEHLADDASAEEKAAAQKKVDDAESAATKANQANQTAQSKVATAKSKLPAAETKISDAQKAEDKAKDAYGDALIAKENAENEIAPYKTALDNAKKELDVAKKALEDAKK